MRAKPKEDAGAEARRIMGFLASMPVGFSSGTRAVIKSIMLQTSGQMFAQGALFDIKTKPLGAGMAPREKVVI